MHFLNSDLETFFGISTKEVLLLAVCVFLCWFLRKMEFVKFLKNINRSTSNRLNLNRDDPDHCFDLIQKLIFSIALISNIRLF